MTYACPILYTFDMGNNYILKGIFWFYMLALILATCGQAGKILAKQIKWL